jgi:hypothetical protein
VSSYDYDLEKLGKLKVQDYKTPFFFVLTAYNSLEKYTDFDIGNNPYIDIQMN